MASTTDTQTEITLKGSVDIVSEFFFCAINSILYQRGKYIHAWSIKNNSFGTLVAHDDAIFLTPAFVSLHQVFISPKPSRGNPNTG